MTKSRVSQSKPAVEGSVVGAAAALLSRLGEDRAVLHLRPKRSLYAENDPADAVFYIQEGMVKLTARSAAGQKTVVGIIGPGEFLGQNCLVGVARRRFTATALTAVTVVKIDRDTMLDVIRHDAAI